jgi:C-terminal processing protease CtpA/Prc
VEWDSPAWKAGLSVQDQILKINDKQATSKTLALIVKESIPGERTTLLVSRRTGGKKIERSFQMKSLANPNPLQLNILNGWLKDF